MDNATFNEYLVSRYQDQLNYYEKASSANQKKYKNFQWILIIMSTATTILAALPKSESFDAQYIVVACAAIVTILTAALKTFQYQELWVNYRSTAEQLKPEIFYYKFGVGDYGRPDVDKDVTFVSRIETILGKEHDAWPVIKMTKKQSEEGYQETYPVNIPTAPTATVAADNAPADTAPSDTAASTGNETIPSAQTPESINPIPTGTEVSAAASNESMGKDPVPPMEEIIG